MPRRGRIHQQAVCYHLYNRGINRDELFHDERDYGRFVQFAARYKERCGVKVYHWCLMPNHYHLLVRLPFAMLRAFAGGLQQAYALYHHRRHGTCGVLWQGRYHSTPVADDLSLARCGRSIERNPVRAKLAERAWDWPAGSAGFYALGKADELTDMDVRYDETGLSASERQAYAAMLCDAEDDRWMEGPGQPRDRPAGDRPALLQERRAPAAEAWPTAEMRTSFHVKGGGYDGYQERPRISPCRMTPRRRRVESCRCSLSIPGTLSATTGRYARHIGLRARRQPSSSSSPRAPANCAQGVAGRPNAHEFPCK